MVTLRMMPDLFFKVLEALGAFNDESILSSFLLNGRAKTYKREISNFRSVVYCICAYITPLLIRVPEDKLFAHYGHFQQYQQKIKYFFVAI